MEVAALERVLVARLILRVGILREILKGARDGCRGDLAVDQQDTHTKRVRTCARTCRWCLGFVDVDPAFWHGVLQRRACVPASPRTKHTAMQALREAL